MRRIWTVIVAILLVVTTTGTTVLADDGGEMGVFGGISEGKNLPFTMDKYVDSGLKEETQFDYREVIFLSGVPIECKGTITVVKDDVDYVKEPTGTYNEKYTVKASNTAASAEITRSVTFLTSYRVKEGEFKRQIIRSSVLTKWTETIETGDKTYTLDEDSSTYSKSSIEDLTPGVSYYDTVLSYHASYTAGTDEEVEVLFDGNLYGYSQPWSKVETQNITMQISHDGGSSYDTVVELKPFLEAKKTIYYDETDPFPISFGGTYNQRLEREATLTYDVITQNKTLTEVQKHGQALITPAKDIEKLPIPENLDFIEGHWAEEDVKKLYSMEILTEIAHKGMQYEAMPRGDFVKALCLAMDIDTSKYETIKKSSPQVFGDVPTTHPLYKYIMAAYDAKLIKGIGEDFDVDVPITRQEAFVIYIRVIGLERLGVTDAPATPFVDDNKISDWARKEIMAGYKLGIIKGDAKGRVLPTQWISKAEAAAIINRLIDYLRDEIATDYQQ